MAKILLAEDDRDLSEVICFALKTRGHSIQQVCDGRQCLLYLRSGKYDLIILDWMMPWVSGLDVCKEFRAAGGHTPILMLTAKGKIDDREEGLNSGADDYLTKPFDQRELMARVRALLRRPDQMVGDILRVNEIELDTITCKVKIGDEELNLRPKEYSLLEFFMRHPNQVFSGEVLLQRVWLDDTTPSLDNLRTHIKLLRKKIKDSNKNPLIRTVRSKGYMLSAHNC